MKRLFELQDGSRAELLAQPCAAGLRLTCTVAGTTTTQEVLARRTPQGDWLLESGGITRPAVVTIDRQNVWVWTADPGDDASTTLRFTQVQARRAGAAAETGVRSPMTGRVVAVYVQVGDAVVKSQPLVVVEAMKMEHVLRAPQAGVVTRVGCQPGELVEGGADLVDLADVPAEA